MILNWVIGGIVGLVTGAITGFYFEHRAHRQTIAENERLQEQLERLKTMLLNIESGGSARRDSDSPAGGDLVGALLLRAVQIQDSTGRVSSRDLAARFVQLGHSHDAVEAAIASLCGRGLARKEGAWLQLLA